MASTPKSSPRGRMASPGGASSSAGVIGGAGGASTTSIFGARGGTLSGREASRGLADRCVACSAEEGGGLGEARREGGKLSARRAVARALEAGSAEPPSASMTSSIEAKRSCGRFSSARITTRATSSGTAGASSRRGLAWSERMRAMTESPLPDHGSSPVSSS